MPHGWLPGLISDPGSKTSSFGIPRFESSMSGFDICIWGRSQGGTDNPAAPWYDDEHAEDCDIRE